MPQLLSPRMRRRTVGPRLPGRPLGFSPPRGARLRSPNSRWVPNGPRAGLLQLLPHRLAPRTGKLGWCLPAWTRCVKAREEGELSLGRVQAFPHEHRRASFPCPVKGSPFAALLSRSLRSKQPIRRSHLTFHPQAARKALSSSPELFGPDVKRLRPLPDRLHVQPAEETWRTRKHLPRDSMTLQCLRMNVTPGHALGVVFFFPD